MLMNKTEARMILLLSQVDNDKKNVYFLAAKLDKSFSAIYTYLRILIAKKLIKRIKKEKQVLFVVSDEKTIKEAQERLNKED